MAHFARPTSVFATIVIAGSVAFTTGAIAQEEHTHAEDAHHAGLHFSHPLVTESVSPDTKLRVNAGRAWAGGDNENELELEGEYAFHRSFSIEVSAPFAVVEPATGSTLSGFGSVEVALKFANYAFEDAGILLGYGVEFGLPTGDDTAGIGSDHLWAAAPFLNIGYKHGRIELVGFSIFEIPFNQNAGDEFETEFVYNASALVHFAPRLQALVELNGHTVISGDEAGATSALLSPGVKVAPLGNVPLFIGVGASVPLTKNALDALARLGVFYHF